VSETETHRQTDRQRGAMKSYEPSEFFLEFSWVSWVELDTETQNHGSLHIYTVF